MLAFDVFQAGGFAPQTAKVIQLGAANLGRAQQLHFIDHSRVDGENALDAMAEAHLAHGKTGLGAAGARDHYAFERLQAFLVAFLDLYMYADAVARSEVGNVTALGLGQEFFDDQVRHKSCPLVLDVLSLPVIWTSNSLSSSLSAARSRRSGRLR